MTSKILKSILTVAISVLLATLFIITGVLYQHFSAVQQMQLRDELSLAASATEQLGEAYLADLSSDRYRLTWVSRDGEVLFDSDADVSAMENHADREEIREALTSGTGSSTRYSTTLLEKTVYEAVRLDNGSVLRISVSHATAIVLVLGMLQPIALLVLLAIAFSAWLAHRMAKRVVEPLNKLDLDRPMENDAYEELSPLLHRIHAQRQEIKQQMWALQRKQDEFEQITGNMKEALVLLDATGRIVSINPAAKALFTADTSCIGSDFLTIDRKQNMRQAISEVRENGHAYFRSATNGREYQFDLSRIEDCGKLQGIVILAFDVTEQVNAEKHRQEFTANVSHELKTPLTSISGYAEIIESGIAKQEDVPAFAGKIRAEAKRLVALVNDILKLSQLDEKQGLGAKEHVALLPMLNGLADSFEPIASEKGVALSVEGCDATVEGYPVLLRELFHNLIDNAIKYTPAGGSVAVQLSQQEGRICCTVQDTGIGIPMEHQPHVFERFYRVDKSHSRQTGGTGLGLAIVKHVAEVHQAQVQLESTPGTGTRVTVCF